MLRGFKSIAIYTRGFNPPFTEGHLAVARSLATAISLNGWAALVLNFGYSTDLWPVSSLSSERGAGDAPFYEVRIPLVKRDQLFASLPSSSYSVLAAGLESLFFPLLLVSEVKAKASVVHLINCFKLPRSLFRLFRKTPVVAHVYASLSRASHSDLPLPVGFYRTVDAFVATSQKITNSLRSLYGSFLPILTIPPAVDTNHFHPTMNYQSRKKVGLYIGHFAPNRVPNQMFEVFQEILEADQDVSFRLIAPATPANRAQASRIDRVCRVLRIEDRVHVTLRNMSDDEKLREYSQAKFFIFAPLRELQDAIQPPITVLEAMASGLPILATDTYAVDEVVRHRKNAFLVDVESYFDLAGEAVRLLQADQDEWCRWSEESRRITVNEFSLYSMSHRLDELHAVVLES